jgi:hypothetical protein
MIPRTTYRTQHIAAALIVASIILICALVHVVRTAEAQRVAALRQQIAAPSPVVRVHLETIQYATGRPHFYTIDSVSGKDPE